MFYAHLSEGIEAQFGICISCLHSSDESMQGGTLCEVPLETLTLLGQAGPDLCRRQSLQSISVVLESLLE